MKKEVTKKNSEILADKAANKIANFILCLQKMFATAMYKLSKNWQRKQQWLFLCTICLLFGGAGVISILKPVSGNGLPKNIKAEKLTAYPQHEKESRILITEDEFKKLHRFKKDNPQIQQVRPGLFDSLGMVEQLYYSQKK